MSESKQAQLNKQIQQLVQKINDEPSQWQAYVDLITVLTADGAFVQAEELGLKGINLFQDSPVAQSYLAYAIGNNYYVAGYYQKAQDFFKMVNDERLKHDVTMMQAQSWYAQKNYRQALAFALTGTQQAPDDVEAFILLGNIWLALNEMQSAKIAFEHAITLDGNSFDANFGRGLVAEVEQETNPWFEQAKKCDTEKFDQQAQQLEDLLKVMMGGEQSNGTSTEHNDESTNA